MRFIERWLRRFVSRHSKLRIAALVLVSSVTTGDVAAAGDAKHGQYLAQAGGCMACHTQAEIGSIPYAGGRALKTPFGSFYGPNITPDPDAGIGRWTENDFIRAMRQGERPDGSNYFPAFPYPSFTGIADSDLSDLWAYLRTLAPSRRASQPHELRFPFGWRFAVTAWKWLYFTPGPYANTPELGQAVNRGAYLVRALGHCGECHTPRNFLGGPRRSRYLAGGKAPMGKNVPNLTPTRLKKWTDRELKEFLLTGATPDGDAADETMDEVIRNTLSRLTEIDLSAVMAYLRSLPALPEETR